MTMVTVVVVALVACVFRIYWVQGRPPGRVRRRVDFAVRHGHSDLDGQVSMPPKRTEVGEQLEPARRSETPGWSSSAWRSRSCSLPTSTTGLYQEQAGFRRALRRARGQAGEGRGSPEAAARGRCRGCDAEVDVDVDRAAVLCATCAGSVRSAGSDGLVLTNVC